MDEPTSSSSTHQSYNHGQQDDKDIIGPIPTVRIHYSCLHTNQLVSYTCVEIPTYSLSPG